MADRTTKLFALPDFRVLDVTLEPDGRTEDQHVIDRETYWKEVLLSRSLGHNKN